MIKHKHTQSKFLTTYDFLLGEVEPPGPGTSFMYNFTILLCLGGEING